MVLRWFALATCNSGRAAGRYAGIIRHCVERKKSCHEVARCRYTSLKAVLSVRQFADAAAAQHPPKRIYSALSP
jgi:hypothetical protein